MKTQKMLALLGLALTLGACSGGDVAAGEGTAAAPAAADAPAAQQAPAAAGNIIEVKMITDGASNYFEPAAISAKQGDVIRFVQQGVMPHNVSFPADQNAGLAGLPGASPYLTTAGQTYDLTVDFGAGTYAFQCDPHAMMGMVGTLTVE